MKKLRFTVAVAAAACALVAVYQAGRAHAYGVPQTGALAYTGSLLTFGAPDNGSHSMSVALWVSGASASACNSPTGSVTCVNGGFSITLPDSCATVIHQNPNVEVQLTVDGIVLGMQPVTAVPYTLEADTASNAATGSTLSLALVPTGTVIPYWGVVGGSGNVAPPAGWLFCNGQAVSRTTYASLFAVTGVSAGAGNGSTTFNVPDLRGYFLRGLDQGVGRDPDVAGRTAMNSGGNTGNALGSVQGSQYQSHNHGVNDPGHSHSTSNGNAPFVLWNQVTSSGESTQMQTGGAPAIDISYTTAAAGTGISIQSAGGNETRALNAAVNFLIKT